MPVAVPLPASDQPLTHADRQALTSRLLDEAHRAGDDDQRARTLAEVVEINLRVARAVARRYAGRGLALEDIEQVAAEALVKAVRRFDVDGGHDLLTYAVPTIRGEVLRHFRDHGWSVRPPRRVQEAQARIRRSSAELAATLGREPTDREVREAAGVSREDFEEAAAALGCFRPTSLDQLVGHGEAGATLGELLPDPGDPQGPAEARVVLRSVMRCLDGRDRHVLHLRYVEERSQAEIGDELGVTQATVSRWLIQSLDRLRAEIGQATA